MMRMSEPQYSFEIVLDECCKGVTGNDVLRKKVVENKSELLKQGTLYSQSAKSGVLHIIQPPINSSKGVDYVVINNLYKSDLIKIYEQYFVGETKPARKIYDAILSASKEVCPFCGGVGISSVLDHFLPKALFPAFSVLPLNLVPICNDCNEDYKKEKFAKLCKEQYIHPYLSHQRFFDEQWIFTKYNAGHGDDVGEFEYFVNPPEKWCLVDKERVKQHFVDFGLAKRYAIKAAGSLAPILQQIRMLKSFENIDSVNIISIIKTWEEAAVFVNHWHVGMSQALQKWVLEGAPSSA